MKNRTHYADRKYIAKRRKAARANGLCGSCCKRKPPVGRKTCDFCCARRSASDRRVADRRNATSFCLRCFASHPRGAHVSVPRLLPRAA